jgi:hypothetical protein
LRLQASKYGGAFTTFEDGRKALTALLTDTMRELGRTRRVEEGERGNGFLDFEPTAGRYRDTLAPAAHGHEARFTRPLWLEERNGFPEFLLQRSDPIEQLLVPLRQDVELQEPATFRSITAKREPHRFSQGTYAAMKDAVEVLRLHIPDELPERPAKDSWWEQGVSPIRFCKGKPILIHRGNLVLSIQTVLELRHIPVRLL